MTTLFEKHTPLEVSTHQSMQLTRCYDMLFDKYHVQSIAKLASGLQTL
jgi:hypothetical protein